MAVVLLHLMTVLTQELMRGSSSQGLDLLINVNLLLEELEEERCLLMDLTRVFSSIDIDLVLEFGDLILKLVLALDEILHNGVFLGLIKGL